MVIVMPTFEQIKILVHLKEMGVGTTETFRLLLEQDASHLVGHLVRDKYISLHSDGLYTLLKKGDSLISNYQNYIPVPSEKSARKKTLQISNLAVLLKRYGIKYSDTLTEDENIFIPSAHWRKIRMGILSTARFLGVLIYNNKRIAVYDIENGSMEWQGMAESSLFYWHHGKSETCADAMLMICRDDAPKAALQIIQRTMWDRKRLIKRENYSFEPNKPQKYSKSPIKLKSNYNKVLLCDWNDFKSVLDCFVNRKVIMAEYQSKVGGVINEIGLYNRESDIEDYPRRYFVNLENDLLRFVYLWDRVKWMNQEHDDLHYRNIDYHLIMRSKYKVIGEKIGCDTEYVDL